MRPLAFESLQAKIREEQEALRRLEAAVADTQEIPVPIQGMGPSEDEEKPAPVHEKSREPTDDESRLRAVLAGISEEHFERVLQKFTRADGRWGKERKVDEILAAGVTIDQIYAARTEE